MQAYLLTKQKKVLSAYEESFVKGVAKANSVNQVVRSLISDKSS